MRGAIASGSGEEHRPPEPRLQRKIKETREIASQNGLDLESAPLLVTFEMPIWGPLVVAHENGGVVFLDRRIVGVLA